MGDARTGGKDVRLAELLDDLTRLGLDTAPHVVRQLREVLHADVPTIRDVVATLDPDQRSGAKALPEPLPCVPRIHAAFSDSELTAVDRQTLLIACLSTDGDVRTLLAASGREPADLRRAPLTRHLEAGAGRFAFRDARAKIWLQATATAEERSVAHERLGAALVLADDGGRAAWHRARAAIVKRPDVVPVLLAAARRLLSEGHAPSAFRAAAEAFDHAEGAVAETARLLAGTAALNAGRVLDGVEWLGSLFVVDAAPSEQREDALASLLIAESFATGVIPIQEPAARRPRGDDRGAWRAWGRAAAFAAIISAERKAVPTMRSWLQEAREADHKAVADGGIRDPAVALCRVLTHEHHHTEIASEATFSVEIAHALNLAVEGDIEAGLDALAGLDAMAPRIADPLLRDMERTPLSNAYRAVTEVLLRFWQGDVSTARARLLDAADRWPVALPFAGLGVHLARRLDLAVYGRQTGLSASLSASLPAGIRVDSQADLAIEAYLSGAVEEAADRARLWQDRGAPGPIFSEAGIDEIGPYSEGETVEPAEARFARRLCHRIRGTAQSAWQREYTAIAEQARRVRSPFRRGRVEALLGTTCAIRGDRPAGRRHLRIARALFEDAGADAWRASVDVRLAQLGDPSGEQIAMPIIIDPLDPMAACRAAWSHVLTDRELQVAMLIVGGAANREIAEQLDVSIRTVEVHAGRVFGKLDVRGRVELTGLAHRTNQLT